jgi:hypothetical protein
MRFTIFSLCLLALPMLAVAQSVDLRNDREGTSFYSSSSDQRAMGRALKQVDQTRIIGAYEEIMREADESKLCSFDISYSLEKKLHQINPKFSETEGAILYLRSQNEFDDIVTKILLMANRVSTTDVVYPKTKGELLLPNSKTIKPSLEIIKSFTKKSSNLCFDEAYKTFYNDLLKINKDMESYHLEALLVEALQKKMISFDLYLKLEQSRLADLQSMTLSLKTYLKKIKSLRRQFPLRDQDEKSNFVTKKLEKIDLSRRQRLIEGYSDLQIMIMSGIVKKLRTRLESTKVEILIYDRTNGVETITLDPMERFRLAIKILRKEMALLPLNTYFAGRSPDYMDIMAAAYEVGVIPASELEEVAGLQDIWNPKKTFWDKAGVWVRMFSSVATIALPPPYGFVPALALVVIEMTVGKNNNNDDPSVLF